ncbi:hypothetical protein NVP1104O_31 [Vibrio phage 1.104.O._10N.286.49.A12]|nr:hypothetical protein NVP1104O_31 [Vibrio phage 1.104.O._10N.286.49.A12]
MRNKKVKLMICSVLNRNGGDFGYYSLIDPKSPHFARTPNSYALRAYGRPLRLSLASVSASVSTNYAI